MAAARTVFVESSHPVPFAMPEAKRLEDDAYLKVLIAVRLLPRTQRPHPEQSQLGFVHLKTVHANGAIEVFEDSEIRDGGREWWDWLLIVAHDGEHPTVSIELNDKTVRVLTLC